MNGCEDIDLCLTMREAGLSHFVVHDSVVEHVKGASERRKLNNVKNTRILDEKWGERIRSRQSAADQFLHARTYLFRGLTRPWLVKVSKFLQAAAILLGLTQVK